MSTFPSKGPLTSLISSASYFNLGDRTFLWGAKWWRNLILGPLWQRGPPIGEYGVRLIRLWGGPRVDVLLIAFLQLWLKFWDGIDKYWTVPARKLFYFHHWSDCKFSMSFRAGVTIVGTIAGIKGTPATTGRMEAEWWALFWRNANAQVLHQSNNCLK